MRTLIRSATVVDGTETPGYTADVLVDGGTIAAIGTSPTSSPGESDRVIDADGLVLSPGFIDMHAHSDLQILLYSAELLALCQTVAELGGFFAPHHRSYGKGSLEAYAEMIDLTSPAGCALHLSHAPLNFAPNKGRAPELLAMLDDAIARGDDITLDTYPYLPGATTLSAVLPSWSSAGGPDETLQWLHDPAALARIRQDLEVNGSDGCHGVVAEWDTLEISGVTHAELEPVVGQTIEQLAAAEGRDPFDVFVGAKPHPRAWGTFPRYLGHYSRELRLLSLEECVGHLTGRAARRLKLRDRGFVLAGYAADLVLFDPDTIDARATYDNPRQAASGIPYVFVGGRLALDDGQRTDVLAGRALRRQPEGDVA